MAGVALCVAGVALMALGWLWWRAWFYLWRREAAAVGVAGVAGTWRHPSLFHVAGVRLPLLRGSCGTYGSWRGDIHLRFTWQAWCSRTTCRHTTYSHTTCSHTTCHHTTCSHTTCRHTTYSGVAGVALMALGWLWWRAWF